MAELTSQLSLEKSHLLTLHLISIMTNDQQLNHYALKIHRFKR
jgi:hypothetical protein